MGSGRCSSDARLLCPKPLTPSSTPSNRSHLLPIAPKNAVDQLPESQFPLTADIVRDFKHAMETAAEAIIVAVEEANCGSKAEQGRLYVRLASAYMRWLRWLAQDTQERLVAMVLAEALQRPLAGSFEVQREEARALLRQTFRQWSRPDGGMAALASAQLADLLPGSEAAPFAQAMEQEIIPLLLTQLPALHLANIAVDFDVCREPLPLTADAAAAACSSHNIFEAPHRWRKRASEHALVAVSPGLEHGSVSLLKPTGIVVSAAAVRIGRAFARRPMSCRSLGLPCAAPLSSSCSARAQQGRPSCRRRRKKGDSSRSRRTRATTTTTTSTTTTESSTLRPSPPPHRMPPRGRHLSRKASERTLWLQNLRHRRQKALVQPSGRHPSEQRTRQQQRCPWARTAAGRRRHGMCIVCLWHQAAAAHHRMRCATQRPRPAPAAAVAGPRRAVPPREMHCTDRATCTRIAVGRGVYVSLAPRFNPLLALPLERSAGRDRFNFFFM